MYDSEEVLTRAAERAARRVGFAKYKRYAAGEEPDERLPQDLRAKMSQTHGVLLYIEDLHTTFCTAGMSPQNADVACKAIAKNIPELLVQTQEQLRKLFSPSEAQALQRLIRRDGHDVTYKSHALFYAQHYPTLP